MAKTSVLLAARNEPHLPRMVAHLLTRLTGDFEILIGLDGWDGPLYAGDVPPISTDPRVRQFFWPPRGLKPTINDLAKFFATGDYLFKLDAHCAVSEGIDETLAAACEPNWMLVPRFYTLDGATWAPRDNKHCDYWLLDCPLTDPKGYRFRAGGYWFERTYDPRYAARPIDETLTHHGSGWFVRRDFFLNELGGMQSEGYGVSYMEPADLGLRMWLGPWDGKVMVVKDCWYAHLHQQANERGYGISMREIKRSYRWTAEHWMRNEDKQQVRPLKWLIDRFAPVPTWPADWEARQRAHEAATPWDAAWESVA